MILFSLMCLAWVIIKIKFLKLVALFQPVFEQWHLLIKYFIFAVAPLKIQGLNSVLRGTLRTWLGKHPFGHIMGNCNINFDICFFRWTIAKSAGSKLLCVTCLRQHHLYVERLVLRKLLIFLGQPKCPKVMSLQSWAQFCCKMWGGQLDVKPI